MECQIDVHRHVYRKWFFFRRYVWHAVLETMDGMPMMMGLGDTKDEAIAHLIQGATELGFRFDSDDPKVLSHLMRPRTSATE